MIDCFYGPNGYSIKIALGELVGQAKAQHGEYALERFDGEALTAEQLTDVLQGASLFAPHRLVIIRDAGKNKPVWEALGERVAGIPDSLTLVLVETAPDKRTKTFKALQKHARMHEAKELSEAEAVAWLVAEAKQRGGAMAKSEAAALVQRAGLDQYRLSNELDKLLLYGATDQAAIDTLVELTPQANAFALLDATLKKQPQLTTRLLADAKITEDPYMLFGLLASQVMQLAALVHGGQRNPDEIAAALEAKSSFPLKKLAPVARDTSKQELRVLVQTMSELDDQIKSSGIGPWQLLEQTLMKIAAR